MKRYQFLFRLPIPLRFAFGNSLQSHLPPIRIWSSWEHRDHRPALLGCPDSEL